MATKYILEMEDKPFELLSEDGFTSEKLYRVKGFNSLVFDWNGLQMLTPYTEPDIKQVNAEKDKIYDEARARGYDEGRARGYQEGLFDAWEAARKIWEYDTTTLKAIFGEGVMRMDWFMKFTASEAIEKIRQYEQEKEEQIQIGDEVKNTQTDARFIVTHMWVNNHGEKGVSGFNYECSVFSTALDLIRKTGRHFPEIAEVLRKMKETDNG